MDAQSIITQVCHDDTFSSPPSCISKAQAQTRTPRNTMNSNASSKSNQGSLLSRLLCCFRSGVSQSSESFENNNHVRNQNGNSRKLSKHHQKSLLRAVREEDKGKICLVVDLDETLVHSSFTPVKNADFIIPVEIDGINHQVYVLKRPHVDEFLQRIGQLFECVLFTASLGKYADPVTDLLDKWSVFKTRLFREACVYHMGNYVKDLSLLGRDVDRVVIVDNSPISYNFHPRNAVPVLSWFEDPDDHELRELLPFFEQLAVSNDIYQPLHIQQLSLHRQQNFKTQQLCSVDKETVSGNGTTLNATFSPPPTSLNNQTPPTKLIHQTPPTSPVHQTPSTPPVNQTGDNSNNIPNNININNNNNNKESDNSIRSTTNVSEGSEFAGNEEISTDNNIDHSKSNCNNKADKEKDDGAAEAVSEVSVDLGNVKFVGDKMTKKKMIAEMIVDGNKKINGTAHVMQQQQITQEKTTQQQITQQQQLIQNTKDVNKNKATSAVQLDNKHNKKLDQQSTHILPPQQQHKTSAPELQHLSTNQQHSTQHSIQHSTQQQRNSYQPISNPLHKQHISSISSTNVNT